MKDVIIVGGGLAGLICSIELAKAGLEILLLEKKVYPFHRVCGEYISNESKPYLKSLGVDFDQLDVSNITNFLLSSPSGNSLKAKLDLGGFGISRYSLDYYLYQKSMREGTNVMTGIEVEEIIKTEDAFLVSLTDGSEYTGKIVIGAFGKRSKLDKSLNRRFVEKRSPYLGVKYHIKTEFPKDLIALHNFKDGYCGISKIEKDLYNLCYLSHRNNLKTYKSIKEMEENILWKNPFLKDIFKNSQFLFEKPEVINEISFEKKTLVEKNIFMVGDSAGMITPLCGNGMSMAIHGAKILSECIKDFFSRQYNRSSLEKTYSRNWNATFNNRLIIGRTIQSLFGKEVLTEMMVRIFKSSPLLSKTVIKQTHGKPF